MINNAIIKPEWLEIIACCCPKVQMDLIRAIVTWQTDGTTPDFRGTKKALFLMMVHDLTGETAVAEPETKPETEAETATAQPDDQTETQQSEPVTKSTPVTASKRKKSQRDFFPYHPLY